MILRARCILPIGSAPIENGAISIDSGKIKWIGPWRQCDTINCGEIKDLGEVALLPGLINAHCHLDYTSMAGQIPPPKYFPDWVKTILSFKAHWSFTEFAESWLKGARMLLDGGVTMVADIESAPELLKETWPATPLRIVSFIEMTGVKSQRATRDILSEAVDHIEALPKISGKEVGLSPHSLYSTTPDLVENAAILARERNWLLTTHLAESESEYRMFTEAGGPFFDWLKGQRNMSDCGLGSPVKLAHELGLLGPDLLGVHLNYLAPGDVEFLSRSQTNVVHCPRSHTYFSHDPFPYESLKKGNVNISLGTDSLATTLKTNGQEPRLSLWDEMKSFSKTFPGVSPREIFEMVTLNPAKALAKTNLLGQLKMGAHADIIALSYTARVTDHLLYETLLHEQSLREVFIAGELARNP
jgi:cytosine/adenosine deaminase-related metal-dependent hydrolase